MTTETAPGTDLAPRAPQPVAVRRVDHDLTDSWTEQARPIMWLAEQIADTDFVPRALKGNAPAVAAIILFGREVGLPPMTALSHVYITEGKPGLSAKGLRAKVLAEGHELEVVETSGALCTVRGRRRGADRWTSITWTIGMAQAAGLANKNTYRNYPRRMLQARATSELCDLVFPDVTAGMVAAEILEDELEEEQTTAGPGPSVEGPKQTVSRARRAPAKAPAAPVPSGEPGPVPSTPPAPLDVDVPLPDAPGPSGSGGPNAPEPEQGTEKHHLDAVDDLPAEPTDLEVVQEAAANAPERDQDADVISIAGDDPTGDRYLQGGPKVSAAQLRMLGALWSKLSVGDEDRRAYTATLIGHELEGGTTKSMTKREATFIIDGLNKIETVEQLDAAIASRISASSDQGGEA